MDKQDSEPAGETRTGANNLPLSPNPSNASSSLGEGHSCFQLAEPVSQLPFRTQHLLSHRPTDCLSLEGSSPLGFNTALSPFLL